MPSSRVIAVLDRLFREHGAPELLRSDNGPEFLSKALRRWLAKRNVKPAFIEPGKCRNPPYSAVAAGPSIPKRPVGCVGLGLTSHQS